MGILRIAAYCFTIVAATAIAGAQQISAPSTNKPAPPTREQVDHLLSVMHTGDAQAPQMHEQLEAKRKTLPPGFPQRVWDEAEKNIEAIHYADVCLPLYQKYLTGEQVDLFASLFEGPTGQQIATIMSGMASKAVAAGHSGYAADADVGRQMTGDPTIPQLMAKRMTELPQDKAAQLRAQLLPIKTNMQPIEDGCQAAYNKRASEVMQSTLRAHISEIEASLSAHPQSH